MLFATSAHKASGVIGRTWFEMLQGKQVKQPEEISRAFMEKLLSRLEEFDGVQQDLFFNSFLDNLEMEAEDRSIYDEGRQYADNALSQCEAFDSESDREEFLADMFASLKTLVEAGSQVAPDDPEE